MARRELPAVGRAALLGRVQGMGLGQHPEYSLDVSLEQVAPAGRFAVPDAEASAGRGSRPGRYPADPRSPRGSLAHARRCVDASPEDDSNRRPGGASRRCCRRPLVQSRPHLTSRWLPETSSVNPVARARRTQSRLVESYPCARSALDSSRSISTFPRVARDDCLTARASRACRPLPWAPRFD